MVTDFSIKVSVSYLLYSEQPLAKRLILLSGSPLLIRPLSKSLASETCQSILASLDIQGSTAEDWMKALLECPIDKLIATSNNGLPLVPVIDGEILPFHPTFQMTSQGGRTASSGFPWKGWCSGLMIGYCGFDVRTASLNAQPRSSLT